MARTLGKVVGHNMKADTIKKTIGMIFTEVSVTNELGTLATVQVKPSGEGWFELKIDGKVITLLAWRPDGLIEEIK